MYQLINGKENTM